MTTPASPRLNWWQAALALVPALLMLVNASNILESSLGLSGALRWSLENYGLLWVCAALCGLGYLQERRLALWSLPALGLALVVLVTGASSAPVLGVWGLLLVVVTLAAMRERPLAGRSWQLWLVGLVALGAVIFPLVVPSNPGPPVEPANSLVRFFQAALWVPQSAFFVTGMLGLFAMAFAWRLAPIFGLRAGLVPLGGLLWMWNGIGDPSYALGMWTDNQALVRFMGLLPSLSFVVLTLAVLAARGRRAQWVAFLLPLSAGLLTQLVVDLSVRPYATLSHRLMVSVFFYLLPLTAALWLCARGRAMPPAPSAPAGPVAASA